MSRDREGAVAPRGFFRLLVVFLLVAGSLLALDPGRTLTQYVHRIWTVQQGGPSGTIHEILQSPDGFLWLGTQTGLVRFDGVRFTPAETVFQGVPENLWVRAVLPDGQGGLWVGTNDSGIYRFRNGAPEHYTTREGLPSDVVFCLLPAPSGGLWACTGNGLARWSGGKFQVYKIPLENSPGLLRDACIAPDGKIWLGGDAPVLYAMAGPDGGNIESTPLRSIPSDASVRAIACSGDSVWAGTTAGLVQIEGNSQKLFTSKDGLADDGILSLRESRDGSLWVGTRSGFSRLRNREFESFRPQEGLSQSSVTSIFEDREGSLWVGTKHGVNQFVDGRAIPYTVNEGMPSNAAGPLLQDSSGSTWVGTLDAGLARFDGRRFTVFGVKQGLASNTILSLADAGDGVWVGTSRGLNLFRGGRAEQLYTKANGLPSDEIRALYRDAAGDLWAATAAGIAVLRSGRFTIPAGAPRDPVVAVASDAQNRILFSTEHGLFRLGSDNSTQEISPGGTPFRNVDAIYRDSEGLIWLATNGNGLHLLDERSGKTAQFLVRDGMFDGEIYGILQDAEGRMWFACSKGIFSVLRADLLSLAAGRIHRVSSTQYSPTDALRVIECKPGVQPGLWSMRDGRLWFSTIRGLIVLDPAHLQRNVPPPTVVVENPIVNGQSEQPDKIGKLAPGRKSIEFNYTGLSYVAPTRITFSYMLDEYDHNWIDAGTRREAFYTNLPPGSFHFRVKACNSDGLCNEQGSVVAFSLQPHYYQQTWFLVTMAILACLAGWLAYQLRIRRLRQRFELIVAERSRIARELHDTLIQGFSGITMEMQALAGRLRSSEERGRLDEIIRDAAACLKETRRSVAGLRGAPGPGKMSGLGAAIGGAARQITETKDVRLKLKLDADPHGLKPEVEYNLLRIASEAISNSVKHAGARTIEVSLTTEPGALRLSVADDGAGFEPSLNGHPRPGHYGLIGMRERAAQIGAEFEFESAPGRGTIVTVVAPLGRAAVLETVK